MKNLGKRLLSFAMALLMVLSLVPFNGLEVYAAQTAEADLVISTADGLQAFAAEVNAGNSYEGKVVVLTDDIDLDYTAVVIGKKGSPFKGTFDGQNHTVSNLTIYENGSDSDYFADSDDCLGLFGVINTPAVVKNVTVDNPYIVGSSYVGGIVGMAYTGKIENCHVTGEIDIEGFYMVGGITGHGYAKLYDCSVIGEEGWDYNYVGASYKEANLEGDNVGGIVGHAAENNNIEGCTVKNVTVSGTRKVGGIVGITAQSSDIIGCTVEDVTVETTATADYAEDNAKTMSIGGIVGQYMENDKGVNGTLTDCAVSGLTFTNKNGVTVSAGALTGGVRGTSADGKTVAPAEGSITVSGNTASAVEGETVTYLEPAAAATGSLGKCYIEENTKRARVYGEILGMTNATQSVVVKLYSGETLLATTTLANSNYLNSDPLGVNIVISGETSSSWNTVWEEGQPREDLCPDKAVLYIDGTEMNTAVVTLGTIDNLGTPYVWEEITGVNKVGLSGEGTEADPYLITNLNDLIWLRDKVDEQAADGSTQFAGKYFQLTDDIDLAGINWNPIGSKSGDHGSFKGVFDGAGHTISNLNCQQAGEGLGLFARTTDKAEIKNLTLNNVTVKSTDNSNYVAAVVGNAYASTKITNVHVTGAIDISGRGYIGGISGHGYVVMDNVSVIGEGTISSTYWCAGGILGYGGEGSTNIMNAKVEGTGETGLVIKSAAGGLGSIIGMAEDNKGTQPISGSNLSAKNVKLQTYDGGYSVEKYGEYALGYLYGGNPTSILTGDLSVENVTFDCSTGNTAAEVVDAVATVGNAVYFSMQAAVNAATNGDTVKLLKSIVLTDDDIVKIDGNYGVMVNVEGKSITLDMNGKTIDVNYAGGKYLYAVIFVADGAELIVTGDGTIDISENGRNVAYMFWKRGTTGALTIKNGTYHMNDAEDSMVYTNGHEIVTVEGGNFTLDTYGTRENRAPWIFNVQGAGDHCVIVTGGTFNADINRQHWSNEAVVPKTHYMIKNSDNTWTVMEGAVAYVNEGMLTGPYFAPKDVGYATLQEALDAVKGEKDIVINLLDDVTLDITAWETLAIGGETTETITINGNNKTLTFNKLNSDWNHITTNNDAKLILNDMTITDSGKNNGPWNRYDLNFACDVELNKVTSTKALAFKADATLNTVTVSESGDNYAIWVQANGQTVTIDGLSVNSAGRGIKIDNQYVDEAAKVTLNVSNATFITAKKAAILVKNPAGADITVSNVDISKVAADTENVVWNDEDNVAYFSMITVTGGTKAQEGEFPVVVKDAEGNIRGYYKTLQAAVNAATNGDIVTLLTNATGAGAVINKSITIDFGSHTYTFTEGVGSNGTESNGLQILKGNTVTLKNGTLNVAEESKDDFYTIIQNYADLTVTDMTLDGANLDKWALIDGDSIVLSNNSGNVTINGATYIFANNDGDKAYAFDVYDYSSAGYTAPVVRVETTGKIEGKIEVTGNATLVITGGIFDMDVTEYCAEGYKAVDNGDGTYGIVKTTVTIGSVEDLLAFAAAVTGNEEYQGVKVAANPNAVVRLTADLDLANSGFAPIGNGAANAFSGTFDGQGHTISNMTLSCDYYRGVGFFRSLGKGAVVKNVTFVNANVNNGAGTGANHFYGVVAGFSTNLTLDNVDVKDSIVTCKYSGAAMVGCLEGATVIKNADIENVTLTTTDIRAAVYGIIGNSASGHTITTENNTVKDTKLSINGETKELSESVAYNSWNAGENYAESTYVAQIGNKKYSTLFDAVKAAQNGDTITLIGDVVRSETIIIAKSITLDLNSKTLNGSILAPDAELTIQNGSIKNTDTSVSALEINAGKLTLTDVNIDSARHAVRIDGAVEATISGGTYRGAIGTGTGTYHAVNVSGAATVTIEDGTFVGPKGTTADSGSAVNAQSGSTVFIKGGNFSGGKNQTLSASGTIAVSGGTFDMDVTEYCAVGYKVVYEDGTYGVKVGLPEVEVTDIKGTLTGEDPDLTFALNFAIPNVEDLTEEYLNKLFEVYGDYYVDYVLTINGLDGDTVTFNANGNADGYLAGQYDAWSENWLTVPFEDVIVEDGKGLYIMEYAAKLMGKQGLRFTLAEVAAIVQNFDCGVYFTPEFLAEHPDLNVSLQLKVFTEDAQGNKIENIDVATNEFKNDYAAAVTCEGKQTVYYATFAEAYDAAQAGDTVELLADATLTGKLTVNKAITIDGNGCSIIANHTAFILETSADCTFKDITLDTNNKAKGVKIASGNVVFDNVTIPNSNKSDAITVNGSLTIKNYFSVESTYQVFDARNGSVTAEPGTVFDFTSRIGLASPATSDLTEAVDTEGNPFFDAYSSTTYYKSLNGILSVTGLTLLDDVTLNSNLTASGTLDLNGHDLTVAEGKALKVEKNLIITGEGNIDGDINLTKDTATLTAPAGMENVVPGVEGYKVIYSGGVYMLVKENTVAWNMQTGVQYETVAAALLAAKENETVQLLADSDETGELISVRYKRTLDLNGFTLIAEEVMTSSTGAHIKDSTDGKGLLKVGREYLTLVTNEQIAVWKAVEEGYRFANASFTAGLIPTNKAGSAHFAFWLNERDGIIMQELFDGSDDEDGVTVYVRMTYTNSQGGDADLVFKFLEEDIRKYANDELNTEDGGHLYMKIRGLEAVTNVRFVAIVQSGEVMIESAVVSYNG